MRHADFFLRPLSVALPLSFPQAFKPTIDAGQVPQRNVDACRSYLELPHFNKVRAATGKGELFGSCFSSKRSHWGRAC